MAEFQEVIRQYNRMSEPEKAMCYKCYDSDVNKGEGKSACSNMISDWHLPCVTRCNPDYFEKMVMLWAERNPEPQYPTWTEWQNETFPDAEQHICLREFMADKEAQCDAQTTCEDCLNKRIPEHIAQKLCVQPICNKPKTPLTFAYDKVANAIKVVAGERTHHYKYAPGSKLKSDLWVECEY